jgi:thiamine biosynthesis lipoprotein
MEFILGTVCSVNLYEDGTRNAYARIFARIREIDQTMSARQTETPGPQVPGSIPAVSDLIKINQNAGLAPVQVPADLLNVLEQALYYAELSGGAFDPTIGPLVTLWGIGTDAQRVPDQAEIEEALSLVNWRDLVIDREAGTAFLKRPGMALDLGAIAKGYAADEAAALARENNVRRGIFDLGGNILAMGTRSGPAGGGGLAGSGSPSGGNALNGEGPGPVLWRIGIQDPLKDRGAYVGVLRVQDKSIVTSGIYERYFERDGRRYHHILSTADGYPVNKGLLSVTIITDKSIDADSLSTAIFALGYKQGRALIETLEGVEAIFIFEDCSVRITAGLEGNFTLSGGDYQIID